MEFMTEQLQQQWNYVFAVESEDGPNGDSFKVEVTNLYQSKILRILNYKVFYSDPDPLFDEDIEVHILTVREESTSSHLGPRGPRDKMGARLRSACAGWDANAARVCALTAGRDK